MKKLIIILLFLSLLLTGCGNQNSENNTEETNGTANTASAERTATNTSIPSVEGNDTNNSLNTTETEIKKSVTDSKPEEKPAPVETELASYSTKIYSKDASRQKNLGITCARLNETIVEKGSSFSFCNTVGQATESGGYEKADVYKNGKKEKALGGGNCQISSTLYNAVTKVDGLKVTERHEHGKKVPYVEKGKDAAVAYGSIDFKFKNTNDFDIKIYAEADGTEVTTRIIKLQ